MQSLYQGKNKPVKKEIPDGTIEREFGAYSLISKTMQENRALWWDMYVNHPPWESCDVRPLGLPAAIGRELARYALMEFSVTVSGGERGSYLNQQIEIAAANFANDMEIGLCLGGVAVKPYPADGKILVDVSTNFTPTRFDGTGKAVGGVFRSLPVRQNNNWYVRLEYHDFHKAENGTAVYIVENKAFSSDQSGSIGSEVPLQTVNEWADLPEHYEKEGLAGPLFAYFKPPAANNVEPDSQLGISVYAGAATELIRQADEQWRLIRWEYESGRRKIYADGTDAEQFNDDIFVVGPFSNSGDLFQVFSPEFRDDPLYRGFQNILKQIEFNIGLSYGTLSNPEQVVQKTATETIQSKQNQHITEKAIQRAFQAAIDDLLYAMDSLCDIHMLAPPGGYKVEYNWGDGVLDDPETRRQDMAMDAALVDKKLMSRLAFVMKWYKADEKTAREMIAGIDAEAADDVEPVTEGYE